MLQEMERTVALIPEVFQRDEIVDGSQNAPGPNWWRALFVPDAFQNPEYLRFAFAGCLAASVCYVLYNALDWPGIFPSVLTCIVTALSTIGSSLQAQFLRLAGFVVGGLILGISAQILILPAHRQHLRVCSLLCGGNRDRRVVRHLQSSAFLFWRADGAGLLLRQPAGFPSSRPTSRSRATR